MSIFPDKLTRLVDPDLSNRKFLKSDDVIFYFVDYTVGSSYADNEVTSFVHNFKREPSKCAENPAIQQYKEQAVGQAADALRKLGGHSKTFVPIPPSKARSDENYDDRVLRMLRNVGKGWDVRELIVQAQSREALHFSRQTRDPDTLKAYWRVDESKTNPSLAEWIILVDDLVTSGCHFRAATDILKVRFPNQLIAGLFLARAVYSTESPDWPLD